MSKTTDGSTTSKKDADIHVFLLEDELSLVELYSVALQSIGKVDVTSSADDAIAKIESYKDDVPNVILLDLIVPDKPSMPLNFSERLGFKVLEIINKNKKLKGIPVLVMTNLDAAEDRERASELGAVDYIVKSNIVPKQIVERIKKAL